MRVRYQIVIEVTADGMMGPLKVVNRIEDALQRSQVNTHGLIIGHIRVAAIYPVAPTVENPVAGRVPGSDQGRDIEEVKDPRIT